MLRTWDRSTGSLSNLVDVCMLEAAVLEKQRPSFSSCCVRSGSCGMHAYPCFCWNQCVPSCHTSHSGKVKEVRKGQFNNSETSISFWVRCHEYFVSLWAGSSMAGRYSPVGPDSWKSVGSFLDLS